MTEKIAVGVWITKKDFNHVEGTTRDVVLAVSRKDDPEAFGLPGGRLEDDETLEAGAVREAYEETGYRVTLKGQLHRNQDGHGYDMVTFLAEIEDESDRERLSSKETGVVAWIRPETLFEGPFGQYNREVYEAAAKLA